MVSFCIFHWFNALDFKYGVQCGVILISIYYLFTHLSLVKIVDDDRLDVFNSCNWFHTTVLPANFENIECVWSSLPMNSAMVPKICFYYSLLFIYELTPQALLWAMITSTKIFSCPCTISSTELVMWRQFHIYQMWSSILMAIMYTALIRCI